MHHYDFLAKNVRHRELIGSKNCSCVNLYGFDADFSDCFKALLVLKMVFFKVQLCNTLEQDRSL